MLTTENTALILIDYQERLAQVMYDRKQLHENVKKLIKGAEILNLPIIWVEQYPKGLGGTVEDVQKLLAENNEPIAKMEFSAYEQEDVRTIITELNRDKFIVAGIEAHVCIYQTVKQLLNLGKHVEFVQDCISSRTEENKNLAIQKMMMLGAHPTSVEMALFELIGTAKHPNFKEISSIIKQ